MGMFTERLNVLIQRSPLSRKDIARSCQITVSSLSRYLSGERIPRAETLFLLAKALNTTPEYLMGNESETDFDREYRHTISFLTRFGDRLSDRQKKEILFSLFICQKDD